MSVLGGLAGQTASDAYNNYPNVGLSSLIKSFTSPYQGNGLVPRDSQGYYHPSQAQQAPPQTNYTNPGLGSILGSLAAQTAGDAWDGYKSNFAGAGNPLPDNNSGSSTAYRTDSSTPMSSGSSTQYKNDYSGGKGDLGTFANQGWRNGYQGGGTWNTPNANSYSGSSTVYPTPTGQPISSGNSVQYRTGDNYPMSSGSSTQYRTGDRMTTDMVPPVPNAAPPPSNLARLAQSYRNAGMGSGPLNDSGSYFNIPSTVANNSGQPPQGQSSEGVYPVGYTPNGPETPANGMDAMAGPSGAPLAKLPSYGLGTGRNDQIAYGLGTLAKKLPGVLPQLASKALMGPLANSNAGTGLLSVQSSGAPMGGAGHSDQAPQQPQGPQVQVDPATGQQFYIDATGKKVIINPQTAAAAAQGIGYNPTQVQPWSYPQYTQNWAGLPTGRG